MTIAELQSKDVNAPRSILCSMVGSKAHGTANENSDIDIRGVFVHRTSVIVGLDQYKESLKHPTQDELMWELEHFLRIAMKCDPNALECLAVTPDFISPEGEELRSLFKHFLSRKHVLEKYCGFGRRQKHDMKALATGPAQAKSGSHYLRTIYNGIELMKTGKMTVRIMDTEFGSTVLAAKRGMLPVQEIIEIGDQLELDLNAAASTSQLPEEQRAESKIAINDFLIKVRKNNW